MANEAPQWGIEPVPERLRVLGVGDTVLLWGNLAVSLLVIVAGALLAPAHAPPDDVQALASPVLAHRLLLTADAALGRRSAEQVVAQLLATVPVPRGR